MKMETPMLRKRLVPTGPRRKTQREILSNLIGNMTVCIAALCEGGEVVVGACDRMLTFGSAITTEPDAGKIFRLTDQIVILIAGDIATQTELLADLLARFAHLSENPRPVSVKEVATAFEDCYGLWFQRRVKKRILEPLLLDENWHNAGGRVTEMVSERVSQMQLQSDVAAIITGRDEAGCHIWVFESDVGLYCQDKLGFAAVGSGGGIATPQFVMQKHTPKRSFSETLLLVYLAKKRSEAAPGVGQATDLFGIHQSGMKLIRQNESGLSEAVRKLEEKQAGCVKEAEESLSKLSIDTVP